MGTSSSVFSIIPRGPRTYLLVTITFYRNCENSQSGRAICAVDDLGGLASSDRAKKKQMKGDFLRWVEGLAVLTR